MTIPDTQLETWSHQGSLAQSASTYDTVKTTLESGDSGYSSHQFSVFLQGSYGNDTNVFKESDVDLVVLLTSCSYDDTSALPEDQLKLYRAACSAAQYAYQEFKAHVVAHLQNRYGKDLKVGPKAIKILANGTRRNADVIAAAEHRRYTRYVSSTDCAYYSGTTFYNSEGIQINNFPKHHASNCTRKHQATNFRFKPMVRILKNLRRTLVDSGTIESGLAPSYYLEGLLYNVPNDMFAGSLAKTFVDAINWLRNTDRSKFVCANELYYLLNESSPVTWRAAKCETFITAAIKAWNEWNG